MRADTYQLIRITTPSFEYEQVLYVCSVKLNFYLLFLTISVLNQLSHVNTTLGCKVMSFKTLIRYY